MELSQNLLANLKDNLRSMAGWMKFLGIVMIVGGALQALSIIGIIIAWLPIWLGVILTQASNLAKQFSESENPELLGSFTAKLKSYFLITGVLTIVSILVAIVLVVVYLAFGIALISSLIQQRSSWGY